MEKSTEYKSYAAGSEELVQRLVEEHAGWAASIARNVARAWNLDWELDGLDGGAYEALVFCARRFDPAMGVPFRAYARKRIHESSTEEARKSKSWQRGVGTQSQAEQDSREISAKLFEIFPELRTGMLPEVDSGSEDQMRSSVRQMLASASMLAALREIGEGGAESAVDYKRMIKVISELDPVHQGIIWGIYYQGLSMRALATEWEIDELNIVREHQVILQYIFARMSEPKKIIGKLKVRPGLRQTAQQLRKSKDAPPFTKFAQAELILICMAIARHWYGA